MSTLPGNLRWISRIFAFGVLFMTAVGTSEGSLEPNLKAAANQPCGGNPEALAALRSHQNFTVQRIKGVGYGFYFANPELIRIVGGPNVTRGLIIVPADGVAPVSYAPYARNVALTGYFAIIVQKATPGTVLMGMMQHPELQYWALAGHGSGGELAARIALTLQPKVKGLVLIAAALPADVDLRNINLFVSLIYGANDTISSPGSIQSSFSRLPGDASVTEVPGLGHFDFVYSSCVGNTPAPAVSNGNSTNTTIITGATVTAQLALGLEFAQWAAGTPKARSYGDNHYLTPGFNDSKPYPGDIRVRFDQLPIPGTSPQRLWWVFTPSEIKGGLVYYPGVAVEGSAYFPIAFEIAARGHLVVIVQQPARLASLTFGAANTVIDSNNSIFAGVPKGRWAIGGHSGGGSTVTLYLACFSNKVYGAVMHAGGWAVNLNTSEVPVLQIIGSLDDLSYGGYERYRTDYIGLFNPNVTSFVVVYGANHYQTGDYGYQVPDQIATISLETQHSIFANDTVSFLDTLQTKSYAPVSSGPACGPV